MSFLPCNKSKKANYWHAILCWTSFCLLQAMLEKQMQTNIQTNDRSSTVISVPESGSHVEKQCLRWRSCKRYTYLPTGSWKCAMLHLHRSSHLHGWLLAHVLLWRETASQSVAFLVSKHLGLFAIFIPGARDVHKSLTWSLNQVWSLWPGVRVKSEVFIAGVWVKSEVFGHESESSLKSFNGSLKNPIHNPHVLKSSYLWSCFKGSRQNTWSVICFVKK